MATNEEAHAEQEKRLHGHLLYPVSTDAPPEANIPILLLRERLCIEVNIARHIDHEPACVWAIRDAVDRYEKSVELLEKERQARARAKTPPFVWKNMGIQRGDPNA